MTVSASGRDANSLSLGRLWEGWCGRFDQVENGVLRLFHDRMIWRTILAMLDQNREVQRGGFGEHWLGWCYTTTQLIGSPCR